MEIKYDIDEIDGEINELEAKIEQSEKEHQSSDQSSPQTNSTPTTDEPLAALSQSEKALGAELDNLETAVNTKTGNKEEFQKKLIDARKKASQAVENVKNAALAAKQTTPKKDDKVAAQVVSKDAEMHQQASKNLAGFRKAFLDGSVPEKELTPAVAKELEKLAIEIEDDTKKVVDAVKAAKEEDVQQNDGNDTTQTPDSDSDKVKPAQKGKETTELAAPGWKNAAKSIRAKLDGKNFDAIKASLNSPESFKKFFNIRGDASTKIPQAKEIMTDDWIAGELQKIQEKMEAAQNEQSKQQAIQAAGNLATFVSAADMAVGSVQIDPATIQTLRDLLKDGFPKNESNFEQQFLAPLKREAKTRGMSTEDYIAIANDVINKSENLFTDEDLKVQGMKEFIGWYVASRSNKTLNEGDGSSGALDNLKPEYSQRVTQYEATGRPKIIKHIQDNQERWNKIFDGLERLIQSGSISIGTSPEGEQDVEYLGQKRQQLIKQASSALAFLGVDTGELDKNKPFMIFLGVVLEKEGVIQEQQDVTESYVDKYIPQLQDEQTKKDFYMTPKEVGELITFLGNNKEKVDQIISAAIKSSKTDPQQDANADFEDVSPMDPVEFAEAHKEQLETFFGKNPKKASFMRKFLLRDQAKLLYDTMEALEGVANLSGEKLALTKNRPEKVTKPEEPTEDTQEGGEETSDSQQLKKEEVELNEPEETSNVEVGNVTKDEPKQEKVKVDKRFRQYVKSDLQAMVDVMRDVRKLVVQYEKNATRSSVDPRYDGSRLKKKLTQLLEEVQEDIADMVQTMHKAYAPLEMTFSEGDDALEGIILEDEGDAERKAQIDFVEEVYNNAKREYLGQLRVSLESGDFAKAQDGAKKVYNILNNEKFLSMFPTNVMRGGKVMTLKKATQAMSDVIQEFIEIVRDIVLLAKGEYVSPENISRAKRKLRDISIDIEEMFKVPSQIDPKIKREIDKDTATKPDEKPLTNNPASEPETQKRQIIKTELDAKAWFNTLNSGQQEILNKFYNVLKGEGIINEGQQSFWDDLNKEAYLNTDRQTLIGAVKKLNEKDRKILNFLIENDKNNLIRFISFIKEDSELAKEIFSNKSQEPDGTTEASLDWDKDGKSDSTISPDAPNDDMDQDIADGTSDTTSSTDNDLKTDADYQAKYEEETSKTKFKQIKEKIEELYGDKSSKEKLEIFRIGESFMRAYLRAFTDSNTSVGQWFNSMQEKGLFKESDKEDFDADSLLRDMNLEEEPDHWHIRALEELDNMKGYDYPANAVKFLNDEENKDFYVFILKYSTGFKNNIERAARRKRTEPKSEGLEESLKPIIQKMLKEHYNY